MDIDDNSLNDNPMLQNDEDYCMVCLDSSSKSAPLMTPSSFFITDCRCKYRAHEKCMTQWVMQQINSDKRLLCPHCNSNVALAVDYGIFFKPQDVRIDLPMITSQPRSRRQKICEMISEVDICSIICGCFYCVSCLMFIVFVYILK